jgi:hypothetical protein
MSAIRFTSERRERLLVLLQTGRTVEEAAAGAGISTTTVNTWAAKGRAREASGEHREFAGRFDDIRIGRNAPPLSTGDLVRLLEKAAVKGSVQAMKHLLERSWEKKDEPAPLSGEADPFGALEGDQLAQRRRDRTPDRPA